MNVNLISYSKSDGSHLIDSASATELVAFCARVSNPEGQMNSATSEKLIKYLMKHKHWSPLEMVSVCLEIETTRDIARQILRHRSFSFQEFSQRYADPTKSLDFEIREARFQDTKNRQNSIPATEDDYELVSKWNEKQKGVKFWKKSSAFLIRDFFFLFFSNKRKVKDLSERFERKCDTCCVLRSIVPFF